MCIYWISISFKLYSLNFILSKLFDSFFVIVIILFQEQIRVALVSFGKTTFFSRRNKELLDEDLEEIVKVCKALSSEETGALIVFEKKQGLLNYSITGTKLNSNIHSDILYSIFQNKSPLHDGAVIISNGKLQAAGCFLPLSKNTNIERHYGTRHRAALGVTELTDAVVVITSEESGEIKLCYKGEFFAVENETSLRSKLALALRDEDATKQSIAEAI
jgi:diadenylate cyclase